MDRILFSALLFASTVLAGCASTPPRTRELPSVAKTPEWLCSVSFDFGQAIDEVYLGAGKTRDAAIAAARADCAKRRVSDEQRAVCQSGRALAENCSSPE